MYLFKAARRRANHKIPKTTAAPPPTGIKWSTLYRSVSRGTIYCLIIVFNMAAEWYGSKEIKQCFSSKVNAR